MYKPGLECERSRSVLTEREECDKHKQYGFRGLKYIYYLSENCLNMPGVVEYSQLLEITLNCNCCLETTSKYCRIQNSLKAENSTMQYTFSFYLQ